MADDNEDSFIQWLYLIPGISKVKIKRLVEASFTTFELLKKASSKEISKVEGIGPVLAARIRKFIDMVEEEEEKERKRTEKMPTLLICSHCGALVTEEMKRCEICGTELTEQRKERVPVDTFWRRDKPSLYICTNCGAIVSEKTEKCGVCGAELKEFEEEDLEPEEEPVEKPPLEPPEPSVEKRKEEEEELDEFWYKERPSLFICTNCGAIVSEKTEKCAKCGADLREVEEEEIEELEEEIAKPPRKPKPGEEDLDGFWFKERPSLFICTNCGAIVSERTEECAKCGADLRELEEEEVEEKIAEVPREPEPSEKDLDGLWFREKPSLFICTNCGAIASEKTEKCAKCGADLREIEEEEIEEIEKAIKKPERIAEPPLKKPRPKGRKGVTKAFLKRWERVKETKVEDLADELKRCDDLLEISPRDVSTLKKKAYLLVKLGMYDDALKAFERAQLIEPMEEEEYKLEVLNILKAKEGVPVIPFEDEYEEDTERIENALKYYDRLLEIDPTLDQAWQTKGELLEKLGRSKEAVECFEKAIDAEIARKTAKKLTSLSALRRIGAFEARPSKFVVKKELDRGVDGLINATGHLNGLINGFINGRINGLINGKGKVNDLISGLVNGNGLINGEGLYNGRGMPYVPKMKRVREPLGRVATIVAAVLVLMLVVPILSSFLFVVPVYHTITIDGDFTDWNDIKGYEDDIADQIDNRDINLVSYKLHQEDTLLSIYARSEGLMFRGRNEVDAFYAFIDTDNNEDTGYDVGGIGADRLAALYGWNNEVRKSFYYSFLYDGDRNNWSAFYMDGNLLWAIDNDQLELQMEYEYRFEQPKVFLYTLDSLMNSDASDTAVSHDWGAIKFEETTIAPGVVTGSTAEMLKIQAWARARSVKISVLNITKEGNISDSMLTLALYKDANTNGIYDAQDEFLDASTFANSLASFEIDEEVTGKLTIFAVADIYVSSGPYYLGLHIEDVVADATTTITQGFMTNVYIRQPEEVGIDGAFADWVNVTSNSDADDDLAIPIYPDMINENVDIRDYKINASANMLSLYMKVDGKMFGGADAPVVSMRPPPPSNVTDDDLDTVPDEFDFHQRDFNNDGILDEATGNDVDDDGIKDYPIGNDYWLNTTIPPDFPEPYRNRTITVYIGPVTPSYIKGIDEVRISIDSDGNTSTGLLTYTHSSAYGFDHLIVATGRNQKILSSSLFEYNGSSIVPWRYVEDVEAKRDTNQLEVAVSTSAINLMANHSVLFKIVDWNHRSDESDSTLGTKAMSLGSLESTKSPAGDNVVLNEVSSIGSPEWIELANPTASSIDLSGWTIQIKQGGGWTTIYTFPVGSSIGAWGSGTEYLTIDLNNQLPDKGTNIRLVDGTGTEADQTKYGKLSAGQTWARFKAATDGKPVDTDSDNNDWYKSSSSTKGSPNDRYAPDVTVLKAADKVETSPGDTITYTINYDNNGEGNAGHVWINDTLPNYVTYQSSSEPYDSFNGRIYRWHFIDVTPGTHSFTITVRVNDTTPDATSLVNDVNLDYTDQLNRQMTSSSDSTTTISRRPIITVEKIADKDIAGPGDTITYTVYYNNTGTGNAGNVWVNDTLPNYVTFRKAHPKPDLIQGQILRWHFTGVGPGSYSISIEVDVNVGAPTGNITNIACLNYTADSGLAMGESCDAAVTFIPEFHDAIIPILGILAIVFLFRKRMKHKKEDG